MLKKGPCFLVIAIIAILLLNSACVSAIQGRIGNARMILYPEVNGWFTTTIEKSILVKNMNDIPIDIKLEIDEESSEFIKVIDSSFTLEPGTEKNARFNVRVKKEGTYDGKINVFFTPIESKEPGVVLSSEVIVIAKKAGDYSEENDDETQNQNKTGISFLTGGITGVKDKISNPLPLVMGASSFILLIVLTYLLTKIKRKKK